jgi:hypothetical protein
MNSHIVRTKIMLASRPLNEAFGRVWSHPELPRLFPAFMILLYRVMSSSVPLMEQARDRAILLPPSDPLRDPLIEYYDVHTREERNHDVWMLDDLEALGLDRSWVESQIPSPHLDELIGAPYGYVNHYHPVMLLGYIAVLEGSPPEPEHVDWLTASTGLPHEAFRTYALHGRLDPHHKDALDALFDSLTLTPYQAELVGISAIRTCSRLARCVAELNPLSWPD